MPLNMQALQNDYKVVDDLQTVIVSVKTATTPTTYTVTGTDAHDLTQREVIASAGVYQSGDRLFTLGANQVPGASPPKPGDSLVDAAGITWELLDAALDDFGISWECTARKAR